MKKHFNNKGAALVSVMIAIAFLSIIATTLLSISVNNYQMKVTQNRTKANFYETEQDFNVIVAKIRTEFKNCTSAEELIKDASFLGATQVGSTNTYQYSPSKLESLALKVGDYQSELADGKNDNFVVTSSGVITFDSSTTLDKVTIKDISVSQKSYDGFVNTIKSDVIIYAEKASSSTVESGVGDFSVIMDSLICCGSDADSSPMAINMFGNGFFCKYDSKYDPADYALVVGKNCRVGILGDYCISYGGINVKDGGLLIISGGNLTCYGNIKVEGSGAIVCSGNIYMDPAYSLNATGKIYPSTISPTDVDTLEMKKFLSKTNDPAGVTTIKDSITMGSNAGIQSFGILPLITKEATPISVGGSTTGLSSYKVSWDGLSYSGYKSGKMPFKTDSEYKTATPLNLEGVSYRTYFFKKDSNNPVVVNQDFSNSLVFNWNSNPVELRQGNSCATIISNGPVSSNMTHGISLTKIGNEAFHRLTIKDPTDPNYNSNINEIKIQTTNSSDGNYNYQSVFRVGDFFADNADSIMNSLCATSTGGDGESSDQPVDVKVNLQNWIKE